MMLQEPKYPVTLEKISDDAPQDICRMYFHVFSTIFDFMNPYCAELPICLSLKSSQIQM